MDILHVMILCIFLLAAPLNGAIALLYLGFFNKDLRALGSKNPGATNAARILGPVAGIAVFLFDALKIYIPLKILSMSPSIGSDYILPLWFLMIFLHCYSPYHQYQGGKGVAAFFGGFFAFHPLYALLASLLWLGLYYAVGIAAFSSFMVLGYFLGLLSTQSFNPIDLFSTLSMITLIGLRHKNNLLAWKSALEKDHLAGQG